MLFFSLVNSFKLTLNLELKEKKKIIFLIFHTKHLNFILKGNIENINIFQH